MYQAQGPGPMAQAHCPDWQASGSVPASTLGRGPWALGLTEIHPHGFGLGVVLERVHAHLATEAALLVPAERGGGVVDVVGVDPDRAGLELRRDVVGLLEIARPD